MARILIVEDQKIMQKYFEFIILQDPDLKLVDTISDAREAVKICNYSVIDLVLMDVQTFQTMTACLPERQSEKSILEPKYSL